ncbi:Peroxisomal membrane protein 11D [Nymphaea thermarum]|nr:Peroxisomal membrane protein 11D [Nymphaea thermarum]
MTALDVSRAELALLVAYLNKAEARDKICRAIQYGSKFVSNGEPGTAQNVDKSTSLARKVFRLFKNKERAELIGRISLFCWLGSNICSTIIELAELGRLSASMKKLEKTLKENDKTKNEQYLEKAKKSKERSLALVKASIDTVVAVGLLQLAPGKVTPRVTGGFGFVSSLISCYQLLPSREKSKPS